MVCLGSSNTHTGTMVKILNFLKVVFNHGRYHVMLVCMVSCMMIGYGHANHAFRVNVHS